MRRIQKKTGRRTIQKRTMSKDNTSKKNSVPPKKQSIHEIQMPGFAIDHSIVKYSPQQNIQKLITLVHDEYCRYRSHRKLRRIAYNKDLAEIAQIHAEKMASERIPFGHHKLVQRSHSFRKEYNCCRLFENAIKIAMPSHNFQDIAEFVHESWNNSPSHKFALEYPHINRHGIGIVNYGDIYVIIALYAHIHPAKVPKCSHHRKKIKKRHFYRRWW